MNKLKKYLLVTGCLVILVGALTLMGPDVLAHRGRFFSSRHIGLADVVLADVVLTVADHQVAREPLARVRAFIPTGSRGRCLATLAESNFPTSSVFFFCSPREVDGEGGINVHLAFPAFPSLPVEALWVVTVFQEGAERYGEPVIFDDR